MPKSIHVRVRDMLEKQAREARRRADRAADVVVSRAERADIEWQTGYERAIESGYPCPRGSSKEFAKGWNAGLAAADRELLGDY